MKVTKEQRAEMILANEEVLSASTRFKSSFRVGANLNGGHNPYVSPERREVLRAELEAARATRDALRARYGV